MKIYYIYRVQKPDGTFSDGGAACRRTTWTKQASATNILKRSPVGSVLFRYTLGEPETISTKTE